MLQADSEKLRQAWVQAVQASIASAYRESPDSCYSEVRPSRDPPRVCTRACVLQRGSPCRLHAGVHVSVSTCSCTRRCARRVYVRVSMRAHTDTQASASGVLACAGISGWGGGEGAHRGDRGWNS